MLAKLRARLTYANVMATIAVFLALGGSAYAVATVTGADVVDESLRGVDVRGSLGTSTTQAVNGTLGTADIAGQAANPANGTPFVNGSLSGVDVRDNSLKGADIDESTLTNIGGGGPAGGDLTGTYPNPQIAPDAVGPDEIAFRAVGSDELANLSVGFNKLTSVRIEHNSASIPLGGGVGSVRVNCPAGYVALAGGARFDFRSGDLASSFGDLGGWTAEGQNNGTADQNLTASVLCLGL